MKCIGIGVEEMTVNDPIEGVFEGTSVEDSDLVSDSLFLRCPPRQIRSCSTHHWFFITHTHLRARSAFPLCVLTTSGGNGGGGQADLGRIIFQSPETPHTILPSRVALFFNNLQTLETPHTIPNSMEDDEHRVMEGWMYRIRSNKFGFQYSWKRYYVLQNSHRSRAHHLPVLCSLERIALCLKFFFLRSCSGSFSALITRAAAEGTRKTLA